MGKLSNILPISTTLLTLLWPYCQMQYPLLPCVECCPPWILTADSFILLVSLPRVLFSEGLPVSTIHSVLYNLLPCFIFLHSISHYSLASPLETKLLEVRDLVSFAPPVSPASSLCVAHRNSSKCMSESIS